MSWPLLLHFLFFSIALLALSKGADYFVTYSSRMAKRFGISDMVVGLTITSIGTSLPELAASISAAIKDHTPVIIGNVVGSNIANIGLILGLAAMIHPFFTEKKLHFRDSMVMLGSTVLFLLFTWNGSFELWEGLVFLILYAAYMVQIIKSEVDPNQPGGLEDKHKLPFIWKPFLWEAFVTALSCLAVGFGANYLINEAIVLSQQMGVSESVIGLTLIAVGTSLPELLVSVSSVRQGKAEMVIGNILGSNIANLLLILGASSMINVLQVSKSDVLIMTPIMILFTLLGVGFIFSKRDIAKVQGGFLMALYSGFVVLAFFQGWS
ncbi:MAG TPA: hypothetical protein DCL41_08805 [Bdellovibrionales bacterium]|nr:hypothetical protein [Bdellovibrionales bacterium]